MKRTPQPSSRQVYPLRMPRQTYWRPPEPPDEVIGYATATDADIDADLETLDEKPEVTSPEWVAWVEHELLQSRAEAAAPDHEPDHEPARAPDHVPARAPARAVPARRVPPVPSMEDFAAWQRVRELEAELAARRRRTARTRRLVAAVAVAVIAVGAGAWWWSTGEGDDGTKGERATTAAATVVETPAAPVELSPGAEHTQVRVLDSGELEVEQWIRGSEPLSGLDLAPPALAPGADEVRVTRLHVVAGAKEVQTAGSLYEPTRLTFDAAPQVYLSYRIAGALEMSGTDGRALARVTSLTVGYDGARGLDTIAFRNATLLSLACMPLQGDGTPVPCGAEAGPNRWRVVPPPAVGGVQVMAQLDLPVSG